MKFPILPDFWTYVGLESGPTTMQSLGNKFPRDPYETYLINRISLFDFQRAKIYCLANDVLCLITKGRVRMPSFKNLFKTGVLHFAMKVECTFQYT